MKYRKKPMVIDAFKWTGGRKQAEEHEWIASALRKNDMEVGSVRIFFKNQSPFMEIFSEAGCWTARRNDYIVLNFEGQIARMTPKTFEATYEKVDG